MLKDVSNVVCVLRRPKCSVLSSLRGALYPLFVRFLSFEDLEVVSLLDAEVQTAPS
jgi:hypothetical protein